MPLVNSSTSISEAVNCALNGYIRYEGSNPAYQGRIVIGKFFSHGPFFNIEGELIPEDMTKITTHLYAYGRSPSLTTIIFSECWFRGDIVKSLKNLLQINPNVTNITFNKINFNYANINILELLINYPNIIHIRFENITFSNEADLIRISETLRCNNNLTEIVFVESLNETQIKTLASFAIMPSHDRERFYVYINKMSLSSIAILEMAKNRAGEYFRARAHNYSVSWFYINYFTITKTLKRMIAIEKERRKILADLQSSRLYLNPPEPIISKPFLYLSKRKQATKAAEIFGDFSLPKDLVKKILSYLPHEPTNEFLSPKEIMQEIKREGFRTRAGVP